MRTARVVAFLLAISIGAQEQIVRGTQYLQEGQTYLYVVGASLNRLGTNLDEGAEKSFAGLECRRRIGDEPVTHPGATAARYFLRSFRVTR